MGFDQRRTTSADVASATEDITSAIGKTSRSSSLIGDTAGFAVEPTAVAASPPTDLVWTDDVGRNPIKLAAWQARWDASTSLIDAAGNELAKRARERSNDEPTAAAWRSAMIDSLHDIQKLSARAKGTGNAQVARAKFGDNLSAFSDARLVSGDEYDFLKLAFVAAEREAKAHQQAITPDESSPTQDRTEPPKHRTPSTSKLPATKGQSAKDQSAKDPWDPGAYKQLDYLVKTLIKELPASDGGKAIIAAARAVIATIVQIESGKAGIEDLAKLAHELGQAIFQNLAVFAIFALSDDAASIESALFITKLLKIPGAAIDLLDQASMIVRGKHLSGALATPYERYMAGFNIARDLKDLADGAVTLGKLFGSSGGFFATAAETLGWANPIALGAAITLEELKFLTANVYFPAKQALDRFLTDLRTGGDIAGIEAAINARPADRDTFIDIAPTFSGGTGEQYKYLYGNSKVFGQGVSGWGWLARWERFWNEQMLHGMLAPFVTEQYAKHHERYWVVLAETAKLLALKFIANERIVGSVG